jgi:hypothetical protein
MSNQNGPSQAQVEAWDNELMQIQEGLSYNDTISSRVYMRQLTNIVQDLINSFKEKEPVQQPLPSPPTEPLRAHNEQPFLIPPFSKEFFDQFFTPALGVK